MKIDQDIMDTQLNDKSEIDRNIKPSFLLKMNISIRNPISHPFYLNVVIAFIFLVIIIPSWAQDDSTEYFFRGQILDPDSIPVENVYLANYRNIKLYVTNEQGRFKIPVLPGDSLKTAHISFESIIIKACPPDSFPVFILSFAIHHIGESGSYARRYRNLAGEKVLLNNFNRNWNQVLKSMQNQGCFVSRGGPKRTGSEDALVKDLGLGFGGNSSVSLSPEAIYKKIKRMNQIRKDRKQRKSNKE